MGDLAGPDGFCFLSSDVTVPAHATCNFPDKLPLTIFFQNRCLQAGPSAITGFTENPRAVKLRYKLVQSKNSSAEIAGQTLAEQPPVVVETFPVSGAHNVEPGEMEIRVRFSKAMTDGSWSWSTAWGNSTPESVGPPHYLADQRTCVMKSPIGTGTDLRLVAELGTVP